MPPPRNLNLAVIFRSCFFIKNCYNRDILHHNYYTVFTRKAFTLAEVLITLGIIGVVAAMTLSPLIQKHKEKTTIVKLKQTLSLLQNALVYSKNENGNIEDALKPIYDDGMYDENFQNDFAQYFTKYLAIDSTCKTNCFSREVKNINRSANYITYANSKTSYKQVLLNNGTALLFRAISKDCSVTKEDYWNICGYVYVDVDGKKNGSTLGKDTFLFYIKSYSGLIPAGISQNESAMALCYQNGEACTNWLLLNENMDYLHCDDLSWDGKTACK